jgi:hypothetical protein
MDTKYKMAAFFHIIPAVANIAGTVYLLNGPDKQQFTGYLLGTVLGIILSIIWLIQVKKALGTHAIRLLKITFTGFLVKLIFFIIFIAGVYYVFRFSRTYFAMAFFLAVFISAIIELWFYASFIKQE